MIKPVDNNTLVHSTSGNFSQEKLPEDQGINGSLSEDFYDTIIKPDLSDTSIIKVDAHQMQTNKSASEILNRHIKDYDDWIDFNVHSNMMLDPFLKNFPKEWMEQDKNKGLQMSEWMGASFKISVQMFLGKLSQEKGEKALADIKASKPDATDHNLYVYSDYQWKSADEAEKELPNQREKRFINLYQIDQNTIGTEAYQKALEQFMKEEDRVVDLFNSEGTSRIDSQYGGSLSEFLKAHVASEGLSKGEWLELAKNNYDILAEHVNRDDFTSRSTLAQERLTRELDLAHNILEDMKTTWKYGDVDIWS